MGWNVPGCAAGKYSGLFGEVDMNGLAHDMILEEMRRLPDQCKYPVPCAMAEDGPCAYDGQERTCPLVKDAQRRAARKEAN
jgi:hypothetical protein